MALDWREGRMAIIKKRRSEKCFEVAEAQSKSTDPLDQALAQINQIVGTINRRMEDSTSKDIQETANRNLEAYLNLVEGKEVDNEGKRDEEDAKAPLLTGGPSP